MLVSMSQREREKEHSIALVFITIKHWMRRVDEVGMRVTVMEVLQAQGMDNGDPPRCRASLCFNDRN